MGVLEAGKGQAEVIKSAVEKLAGNGDAEIGHSVKSDSPIRPGGCSWRKMTSRSGPFTARQARMRRSRSARSVAQVWMPTAEFSEDGNRFSSVGLQHRDDPNLPNIGRDPLTSFSTRLLLAGKPRILSIR